MLLLKCSFTLITNLGGVEILPARDSDNLCSSTLTLSGLLTISTIPKDAISEIKDWTVGLTLSLRYMCLIPRNRSEVCFSSWEYFFRSCCVPRNVSVFVLRYLIWTVFSLKPWTTCFSFSSSFKLSSSSAFVRSYTLFSSFKRSLWILLIWSFIFFFKSFYFRFNFLLLFFDCIQVFCSWRNYLLYIAW